MHNCELGLDELAEESKILQGFLNRQLQGKEEYTGMYHARCPQ